MSNGGHCKSSKNSFGVSQSPQTKNDKFPPARLTGRFGSQWCGILTSTKNRSRSRLWTMKCFKSWVRSRGCFKSRPMKMHQDRQTQKIPRDFDAPKNVKGWFWAIYIPSRQLFFLGSVFKYVLFSPPDPWGDDPIWPAYCSNGRQKTTKWWFWCPKNVTCLGGECLFIKKIQGLFKLGKGDLKNENALRPFHGKTGCLRGILIMVYEIVPI